MVQKEFIRVPLAELVPYENNPRKNDEAAKDVEESIRQVTDLDPIEVDENNVILSGHTRLKALQNAGYEETDIIRYTGLTEEQKKKYRLLANKTGEKAGWDFEKLEEELSKIDFDGYDFGFENEMEQDIDSLFSETEEGKEKEPKKIQCPHCGEWFEV